MQSVLMEWFWKKHTLNLAVNNTILKITAKESKLTLNFKSPDGQIQTLKETVLPNIMYKYILRHLLNTEECFLFNSI